MKELVDYCWKHKLLEGIPENVEVIDAGLHNRKQGPDFFNAKIRIGGTLWVGNVVTLEKASDWYLRGYDKDDKYKNVVLVVVLQDDSEMMNSEGEFVNHVTPRIPDAFKKNYDELMEGKCDDCLRYNAEHASLLMAHAWSAALQTEWVEQATQKFTALSKDLGWTDAYFVMLARQFGFGINNDTYEKWAKTLPFDCMRHHRDDLFQIEAFMLGHAGLLELESVPEKYQKDALNEGYLAKLRNEYIYLAHKYSLKGISYKEWKSGANAHYSPQRCISWLANYFYMRHERSGECLTIDELKVSFCVRVTPYWEKHSQFGQVYDYGERLQQMKPNDLIVKVDVPFFFAYGRDTGKEHCCDHAFDIMEQCRPMTGVLYKWFESFGFRLATGGDCLAVIQQKHEYCMKKQCLRCRFGYNYLTRK